MTGYMQSMHALVVLQCEASVILLNGAGELLLQRRADNGFWGYHGGSVGLDEAVEEAVARELFEETGLTAHPADVVRRFLRGRRCTMFTPTETKCRTWILFTSAATGRASCAGRLTRSWNCVSFHRPECRQSRKFLRQTDLRWWPIWHGWTDFRRVNKQSKIGEIRKTPRLEMC